MTNNDISKYDQLYVHCHAREVSVKHIYGCHFIYSCSRVGEQFIRSLDWFNGKLAGPPHISTGNPWFPVNFPVTHGFPGRKLDISMASMGCQGSPWGNGTATQEQLFKDPRYGQSVRVKNIQQECGTLQ